MPLLKTDNYTVQDIYALPDGKRAELVDGRLYDMAPPGSTRMDYFVKLFKYRTSGVREYWIVNPLHRTVQTYLFTGEEDSNQFSFDDRIKVRIYEDFELKISDLL